jgi:hypothetical protein
VTLEEDEYQLAYYGLKNGLYRREILLQRSKISSIISFETCVALVNGVPT